MQYTDLREQAEVQLSNIYPIGTALVNNGSFFYSFIDVAYIIVLAAVSG